MQSFQWDPQPQIQHTHRIIHVRRNNHSLQNTEEERIRGKNDPSRNRRTHEVPFIAGYNHLTRKITRFRAPASSPKQSPYNIHIAITKYFTAFSSPPLPFVTTSIPHHLPSSPLPKITNSLLHHPVWYPTILQWYILI